MSGLICAGDVYLDLFASGVLTGAVGPINATKFAISPGKATSIDRTSYLRDSFGSALDSVVIPGVSTLSIETDDAAAELLQYALLGTPVSYTHLDVYKRQLAASTPPMTTRRQVWCCLLYTSRCV